MRWTALKSLTPSRQRPAAATPAPIHAIEAGGLELSHLWRYLFVATLVGSSMLLSTWSRIDLVETAVALDGINSQLRSATAERDRLELEIATLRDPRRLASAADQLGLVSTVPVHDVAPLSDGGLIRKPATHDATAISQRAPISSTRHSQPPDGGDGAR